MPDSSFDSVLYKDSPFVPPATVQTAFQIAKLVTEDGYPPAIAIAHELRDVFGEHLQFLDSNMKWLIEKFGVSQTNMDDYYFGLLIPATLIISAFMARYNPVDSILAVYFPVSKDPFFINLRDYATRQIPLIDDLLHLDLPTPTITSQAVYQHCHFEVFSFSRWYQVGLEAGQRTFRQFGQLY